MKVLILHQHFKIPQRGGAIRSYYLAKSLLQAGHEVIVLTGHNKPYSHEWIEGIEVHWLPVDYDNSFDFKARSISFLKYVWQVIKRPALYRNVDICYTISVPLTAGIAALWIKSRYRTKFIFEVGDLWPDVPIEMSIVKNPILKFVLLRLERAIYSRASCIVALSEAIREGIEKKIDSREIFVIPNMSDTDFYRPGQKEPALINKFNVEGKFVVSYIGAVGLANGLDYFVECARESQKENLPICFLMCGSGAMLDGLRKRAKDYELCNLSFIPFQNRDGVREVLNVTDAVFVSFLPFPLLETGSPNKYFDGLSAGKMIIINFGGWIKQEIEERCGIYVDPNDASDFTVRIKHFLDDSHLLIKYQQAARTLAIEKYSLNQLGKDFVVLIEAAARKTKTT